MREGERVGAPPSIKDAISSDKDCIEDLRVYPTRGCQEVIDRAVSVKAGCAELLYAYIDVEPVLSLIHI